MNWIGKWWAMQQASSTCTYLLCNNISKKRFRYMLHAQAQNIIMQRRYCQAQPGTTGILQLQFSCPA
jgi:hypothetical protein